MRKEILEWDPLLAAPLVKKWEAGPGGGVALSAYKCPAGVWTIGWGILDLSVRETQSQS